MRHKINKSQMYSVNQLQTDTNYNSNNKCKIPRNKFNKGCTRVIAQTLLEKLLRKQRGTT